MSTKESQRESRKIPRERLSGRAGGEAQVTSPRVLDGAAGFGDVWPWLELSFLCLLFSLCNGDVCSAPLYIGCTSLDFILQELTLKRLLSVSEGTLYL